MKLQAKLALFNAASKAVIIVAFVILMPLVINHVALVNTDQQLRQKQEQVLALIDDFGISAFIQPDSSQTGYGSYNLLKEEFISLEQIAGEAALDHIENSQREVEEEVVNYRVLSYSFGQDGHQYLLEIGRSLSTISAIEVTLRRFALYLLLAIILLTILTDVAFTKFLLRPLNSIIQQKLKQIQDPAAFHFARIPTTTTDFKYLDDSIHEMMERLEAVFLKEREFISNVSHELLTPISILQSKLENLAGSEELGDENLLRLMEAQKTLNRLKNIIRTLLLISKIENEQYLKGETVTVGALVQEVEEEIEDRLQMKNITLEKRIETDHVIANCNQALLYTMLFNLVNNAVKYNKAGGKITIRGYQGPQGYVLEVNDTGIGIAADSLPFIFNRFRRFSKSDTDSFGLGLPIVQTIASFHQVAIDVFSTPDEGSSFRLTFA
jgi:signal transduction histidine kinase